MPRCHRVQNASANQPVEWSIRFTIESIRSMRFNRGVHGGMRGKSTHIDATRARTQREWWNVTLSNRRTSSNVRAKSSRIRPSAWCCSTSRLCERTRGRQVNPLQPHQMMISSFWSSSIVHTTGSLIRKHSCLFGSFRRKRVSTTGKNKLTSLCLIPIATLQECCNRCDFGGRRPCVT